jgi:hypothetical protein
MNLLGTRFVSRLFLSFLIAHDALVGTMRRLGLRLWHALLAAVFAALILYAFQIVLSGHCDQIPARPAKAIWHQAPPRPK